MADPVLSNREPAQEVRRPRGSPRRRPGSRRRRRGVDHRVERLGQDHLAALRQPAGGFSRGTDPHRRRGDRLYDQGRQALPPAQIGRRPPPGADRHGVPDLQPVPPSVGAPERHPRADPGPQDEEGRGGRRCREMARPCRPARPPRPLSGPAFRRPAATGRDRPGHRDESEAHAVRRGDVGARPGAGERGPQRDQGPGQSTA